MRPHALLTKGKIGVERKYLTRAGSAVERKKERKKANAHDEERERERKNKTKEVYAAFRGISGDLRAALTLQDVFLVLERGPLVFAQAVCFVSVDTVGTRRHHEHSCDGDPRGGKKGGESIGEPAKQRHLNPFRKVFSLFMQEENFLPPSP